MWRLPGSINPNKIVTPGYLRTRRRLLITGMWDCPSYYKLLLINLVSATNCVREGIREFIQKEMCNDTTVINLDFQPWDK